MVGLWDEEFWLPEGVTWDDFKSNSTIRYPHPQELQYTVLIGAVLLIARILVESFVYLPIGVIFGWIDTSKESLFQRILGHLFFGFAGNKKFKRVAESAWRFTYYIIAFVCGYFVLRNEPQLYDVDSCWKNYPYQHVSDAVWWYYIIETGFYWSLLFSTIVFDVRRSDFLEMCLHHVITIGLLSLSFSINFIRVGTLVLFSHDIGDVFIELGKLFRYAKWETPLTILYIVFMITWIGSRLVYYPFWVIHSVIFSAPPLIQKDFRWENLTQRPIVARVCATMLCLLVVLHIFWTYVLLKIGYESTKSGSLDDIREDSGTESEDDDTKKKK